MKHWSNLLPGPLKTRYLAWWLKRRTVEIDGRKIPLVDILRASEDLLEKGATVSDVEQRTRERLL